MNDLTCCKKCKEPVYNTLTSTVMFYKCGNAACLCHRELANTPNEAGEWVDHMSKMLRDYGLNHLQETIIIGRVSDLLATNFRRARREAIEECMAAVPPKDKTPDKQLFEGDKSNENLMLKRAFFRGFNSFRTEVLEALEAIKK